MSAGAELVWVFSKGPSHKVRICWLKTGSKCDFTVVFDTQAKQAKGLVLRRLQFFAEWEKLQNSDAGTPIEGMWELRGHPHDFRGFLSKHAVRDVWVINSALQKKRKKLKRAEIDRAHERAKLAKDLPLPE